MEIIKFILRLFDLAAQPSQTANRTESNPVIPSSKLAQEETPVDMVTMREILKGANLEDQSPEIQANLQILHSRINVIRAMYNKPMIVTSGLRDMDDHLRIYAMKGITDETKIPMKSKHLRGEALDVSDPKRELQAWCRENEEVLVEIGVWMEDFNYTPTWVHFQVSPPRSGKRWFIP